MASPRACLFDLDGLLLDTEPCHGQAWRQASSHFGVRLSEERLLRLRGRRRADCVEQVRAWIAAAGQPVPGPQELLAIQQPIARRLLPGAAAMPGARELVGRCRDLGLPMAMVTSSSREAVALKVAPHAWLAAIELRVLGDDPELRAGKPEPDPFLLAAGRLGVPAAECWVFEDSPAGATAAAAAGCRVHVLLAPDTPHGAFPAGVTFVRSLSEVNL
jgi:HAD superfamily hydrolase (TIGR01509 family)